jgi:hypothetical protein
MGDLDTNISVSSSMSSKTKVWNISLCAYHSLFIMLLARAAILVIVEIKANLIKKFKPYEKYKLIKGK